MPQKKYRFKLGRREGHTFRDRPDGQGGEAYKPKELGSKAVEQSLGKTLVYKDNMNENGHSWFLTWLKKVTFISLYRPMCCIGLPGIGNGGLRAVPKNRAMCRPYGDVWWVE
ncbi:hypothetical protein CEXT_262211 [Caerostris extrusa]|uniref:Uncharacterized protein n=1 Tax=Caerostris extrusa TaxID=172846 RepID=A0AAV4NJ91_CAEEX|nr:hypothetical protein CEXT_262211 [Caerostris extrusa]